MSFSKIFQIIFIIGSTFPFFIPGCLNNSWWCFSSSFSNFEDRRRVSLQSYLFFLKIHGSSFMPSSHNCFWLWEFFSTIRRISRVASFLDHLKAIISEYYSFSAFSSCSPNITGGSFKYTLVSSWSIRSLVSKFPQVSLFHFFLNLTGDSSVYFIRCSILTVVLSRFLFLRDCINSFILLLFQSYRWLLKTFLKFTLYPS